MMMSRDKSDSLMDQVFAAVTLPTVGHTTIVEESHEEFHSVNHHESHHVESHNEHFEYTSSGVTVGNVVGHQIDRRPTVDTEDQRSEVSALSKATSVSVHSSVSQKSANVGHYDLPPIPQYDMPPIIVGDAVVGKAHSTASSKSGSRHSAASHHSHHSQHSHHSALTHDSESTITEGTQVNQPITVGGVVGGGVVVGGVVGSEAPTPLAVGQSLEHDAVIEQFRNLHGRDESVVSSIVPTSVHMHSESEDSIAPSKLTHSIAVGGVVGSQNGINVLHRSHELEYSDFAAPAYYQPPSVQGAFDARSEDSFGFEKVEYVDTVEHYYEPEEEVKQVVQDHVVEHQVYEPYQIVHENHRVPSVVFDEDRDSVSEHHHHDHDHHHHHDSHVSHTFTSDVKQSRSNTASTYQSRQIFAHNVGPKITEELRPAAVIEEEEVEVKPPVMAYVAPFPVKPPRTHEESHAYNAYETEVHHYKDVVKSTTVVQEDVRYGSEGVSALRKKFEFGAPPPLSPVFEVKKHEHQVHHDHHHHHHHQDVVVAQVQTQNYSTKAPQLPREHHYYPLPIRGEETQKHAHDHHNYIPPVQNQQQHVHSASDHQHGYVPVAPKQEQKKVILYEHQYIPPVKKTEQVNGYDRTHHYIPVGGNVKQTTHAQLPHDHHYVPQASPRTHVSEKVSEHVQLGGSRKSTIQNGHQHHHHHHDHHHHHHENHNDVPSRPSSVASSIKHQPHSRTSTVSTVRGAPVQRVTPTVQHHVIQNPYGDHQSVRVVKNVREFVNVFGATHVVPPPTPLAGVPRLPPRSPISHETFQPHFDSVKSSRKSTVVSIGNGVQIHNTGRKSTCSSVQSSRSSSVSSVKGPVIVGGNVIPAPRSRNATLTQENVDYHVHDHSDGEHDLIHVADMRKLFENYGPAHLPEYASSPYAYIH